MTPPFRGDFPSPVRDRPVTHANVSRSKIMNIKTIDVFTWLVRTTLLPGYCPSLTKARSSFFIFPFGFVRLPAPPTSISFSDGLMIAFEMNNLSGLQCW